MFTIPERCSVDPLSLHTRTLGGRWSPISPTSAKKFNRRASMGDLRDRPLSSSAARLLGASREPQIDSKQAFCGDPVKYSPDTVNRCTPDVPTRVRSDLSIDELLSRSCVTSLRLSQSCTALPKESKKSTKQRNPASMSQLVFDQEEPRIRSLGAAGRIVQNALRLQRRNSIG